MYVLTVCVVLPCAVLCLQTAIQKDGKWLKGFHRKACAHQAMGERGVALETYRQALEIEPKNKWVFENSSSSRFVVQTAGYLSMSVCKQWFFVVDL